MKKQLKQKYFPSLLHISMYQLLMAVLFVGITQAEKVKGQNVLETKISLSLENKEIRTALSMVEKMARVKFSYLPQQIQAQRKVTVKLTDLPLSQAIEQLLSPLKISYEVIGERQILLKGEPTFRSETSLPPDRLHSSADQAISGTVTDKESGGPLPGVSILVKGKTIGTTSDGDGRYSLNAPDDATALVFSYVGYVSEEVVIGNRSVIDVALGADTRSLNEVVVTALGIKRDKKALTFATGELKGTDFANARETNLASALSAKVAGVQVTSSAGGMAGASRVIIRGNSSLSGNSQPLYVIDGVPIDNSNRRSLGSQTFATGVDGGDGISNINPNDIESVTVLKGPNGAALYGQLGANGVIIITTKSGTRNRRPTVQYNGSYSVGTALVKPDYQNEYGQGFNGQYTFYRQANGSVVPYSAALTGGIPKLSAGRNPTTRGSWGPRMEGQLVEDMWGDTVRYSPIADPYKEFFQPERLAINTVSVDGGGDKTTYYFSLTNLKNQGFQPTNTMSRNSATLKISTDIAKGLNLDVKANYIRQDVNNRPYLGDDGQNPVYRFLYIPRSLSMEGLKRYTYTPKDIQYSRDLGGNGFFVGGEKIFESNSVTSNPFWTINNNHNEDQRDRIIAYAKLNYQLTKGISIQGRYGTDFYYERQYGWNAVGTRVAQTGNVFENTVYNKVENADLLLTASHDIGDFSIFANAGANHQSNRYRIMGNAGSQLSIPGLYAVGRTILNNATLGVSEYDINSVFAAANVGYKNVAFLDVTARNDWSSTLPVQNNSFFYPSIGGSLILTDALNLKSSFLDYAKVRASWAQAGRSGDPYNTIGYFGLNANTFQNQPLASYTSVITDPNLKNELKTSYEAGAELRFLKNRLLVDFTYYHSVTSNQILPITIAESTGYSTKLTNAGKLQNHGIELLLSGTPVQLANGFKWETSFNLAANRNKVLELIDGVSEILVGSDRNVRITAVPGKPYGVVNAADYAYLRDENGNRLIDANGLPIVRSVPTLELGNANPNWTGGFANNFSYKGLSFSSLIDIRRGGIIFSQGRVQEAAYGTSKRTLEGREGGLLVEGVKARQEGNTWVSTGQPNDVTTTAQAFWNRVASDKGFAVAEEFIYDASYVAIRELRLAYQLPASLFEKTKFIRAASLAVYGRNLGYLERHTDGFSPENSSVNVNTGTMGMEGHSLPMMRNIGIDFNLSF
ncbi:TonB-linked SusC/RagA family outer membrane protein [Rhabdobacter roseus]|uniref:TonB-linked SusC/RagA family outer membrane protein n=1 Tax=Rhabdobacter roseus TaxID=1655419 RepID=A0A840TH83_9BACT|nr:SusC/RagA family TonB-linked outer membrane protein [Rhabdobacter roseus]MBB5282315.1 TonB-linked SusC/RagA family outer membrane protein [Rhabdobacter roseus]